MAVSDVKLDNQHRRMRRPKLDEMETHTWFVKDSEEGVLVDATRHPAGKVLSVLWQLHVADTVDGIWMDDGEIAWLIVARGRGSYTFGHDSKRRKVGR